MDCVTRAMATTRGASASQWVAACLIGTRPMVAVSRSLALRESISQFGRRRLFRICGSMEGAAVSRVSAAHEVGHTLGLGTTDRIAVIGRSPTRSGKFVTVNSEYFAGYGLYG